MKVFPICPLKKHKIGKIKCRIMRISFTGELSYEINVQANYGLVDYGNNVWNLEKNLILLPMVLKQCTY